MHGLLARDNFKLRPGVFRFGIEALCIAPPEAAGAVLRRPSTSRALHASMGGAGKDEMRGATVKLRRFSGLRLESRTRGGLVSRQPSLAVASAPRCPLLGE